LTRSGAADRTKVQNHTKRNAHLSEDLVESFRAAFPTIVHGAKHLILIVFGDQNVNRQPMVQSGFWDLDDWQATTPF